ncbi:protein of unknown function [Mucilaginibacter pineti]|uniref:DUF3857 domain-containing protein n=1 Tax=Mucilaginibacter pineti TaxID=1391627 RepID=A0A1G6ZJ01_9SPHI|nr:DUF3857 domain-containing protein [Mucilaginibacter pineti]SDE02530.1 protein of unknown function [Mucilaginibacter pineti]
MIKQTLCLLIVLLSVNYVHAQAVPIEKEKWTEKPVIHKIDSKYDKESAVILLDKRGVEFTDESKDMINEYYTAHKIIHINDDKGIESFNKIYLGISENADIVEIKARNILPNGKIIELNKNDIKDIKDKNDNIYKIFAMDGLEKGCEVEYYYTFKKTTSFFGREIVQQNFPILESSFQIIAPKRLKFDIKPYNFIVPVTDTVVDGKRIAKCAFKDTQGADEEKYANYYANLRRLEYKLSYNEVNATGERLFNWNSLAKKIYVLYSDNSEKEIKEIADLIKKNGWDALGDETAKITAVENYIKKTFSYNEGLKNEDENVVERIIQNKNAGTVGIMRLYGGIFQALNIKYHFVLTGSRDKFFIDKEFENWDNCDYPIFYFPAENKFLAPTRPDMRYPWIYSLWGATNGLYCKRTTLGTFSTAIAEVKEIPLENYSKSAQNIEAKMVFTNDLDSLNIDEKQLFTGYASTGYRNAFNFSNEDQKKDIIKDITQRYSNSENLLFSEVLNLPFESQSSNLPVIIHTKAKTGALIERAGSKLLLKIGMAIGPQVEMYQQKTRQEPVDMDFGHVEERNLEVTIPEGYTIKNLSDLKINQTYKDNGELTMGFVSDYELKGNQLVIHIMEEYRKTLYPITQFADFRKIINASSDFNKVVLVLEKKS